MMIRSFLYVPGSNERFIAKAHTRGADAIIIDLEDAVVEGEKTHARDALPKTVRRVGQAGAHVFVRVNHREDRLTVDAEAACRAGACGILIPKVSERATLESLDGVLRPHEAQLGRAPVVFMPLIEDARGVLAAQAIAAGPRVMGLGLGAEDLATSMGARPTPEVLRLPKILVHLAAKAEGKRSFGLFRSVADYRDVEAIKAAIQEARMFGFDGATCIHPTIVGLLNAGFSATQEELQRALRLIWQAESKQHDGVGAFMFEGEFVDAPIVERARAILAQQEHKA